MSSGENGEASLRYDATVADRDVAVRLRVAEGETVALLGPNGAGKSTVLGVIAGLVTPTTGQVSLAGRDLAGVPPHRREVALLAQEPLLFPHLTALENVAFGPRSHGVGRQEARALAREWLDRVGVGDLGSRRPRQLSGGQAQRVAVARALAARPRLLLLDEPMAALDVDVAPALRHLLRTVLADRTAVVVTHDALDALLLADRVVVVEGGRVVEEGPTADVLRRPRSNFAARIAGLNLVAGRWNGEAVTQGDVAVRGLPSDDPPGQGEQAVAVFSPTAVSVFREPPGGSPRNALPATVTELEPLGDRFRVRAVAGRAPGQVPLQAEVTAAAVADLALVPGDRVNLIVKATEVSVHGASRAASAPSRTDTVWP
ncbi:ATP-binding cassette domain-containing protein [Nocardioides sp. CER19]|uniref:sulfate/molybdate ABC transporter ATP-binding protein n=1 Tax=Nocardioides sp. CER19 TaxID=3038538 RepID=UPI0024484522|nr:ATP-binding cassette domain-containing protein [Nocardioides sp. CER19]MDH2414950.1 ATP-binding cassette domain-containing protein [Nocardioides sp. CER19]